MTRRSLSAGMTGTVAALLLLALLATVTVTVSHGARLIDNPGEDCQIWCTVQASLESDSAIPSNIASPQDLALLHKVYMPVEWSEGLTSRAVETRNRRQMGLALVNHLAQVRFKWPGPDGARARGQCMAACIDLSLDTGVEETEPKKFMFRQKPNTAAAEQNEKALVPMQFKPKDEAAAVPQLPSLSSPLHRLAQRMLNKEGEGDQSLLASESQLQVAGGLRGHGNVYMWRFTNTGGAAIDEHYKIGQNVDRRKAASGCGSKWATRIKESINIKALPGLGRDYEILKVWEFTGDSLALEGNVHRALEAANFYRYYKTNKATAKIGLKSGYTEVFDLPAATVPGGNAVTFVNGLVTTEAAKLVGALSVACEKGTAKPCTKC